MKIGNEFTLYLLLEPIPVLKGDVHIDWLWTIFNFSIRNGNENNKYV